MRVSITALALLAFAAPASAQPPTVLVEQTIADGRGGTYTRIVVKPAGYVPQVQSPAPQMHGAFTPASPSFAPPAVYYNTPPYSPVMMNPGLGYFGTPCASGRCSIR